MWLIARPERAAPRVVVGAPRAIIFWSFLSVLGRQLFQIHDKSVEIMKKINYLFATALTVLATGAMSQAPAAKGDAAAGRQKAVAVCSGCHGIPGTKTAFPEVYNVPKIGGQNEAYLVAALQAYRSGERYNATMKGLASALTEKEVVNIAAYYAQSGAAGK